jgi:K(+)-stimulated pyrophosphate-energized sodium pump
MQEIADQIHLGAMVFLKREYQILSIFILLVAILLAWGIGLYTALAFIGGAICSILAGRIGMNAATKANVRTANAAKEKGQAAALLIAFNGGTVMGLAVASLGLLGVGILFKIFGGDPATTSSINGFAMGGRDLHEERRRRLRSGRQDRSGHPRGRSQEPGRHRRQRG